MIEEDTPLAEDPYMWLLNRLEECVTLNPEATLVDGLEYAVNCLDRQFHEEEGRLHGRAT